MSEQAYPEGPQPVERTHAGANFLEEQGSMARIRIGTGRKCEEEGMAERNCYELIITLIICIAYAAQGGGGGRKKS